MSKFLRWSTECHIISRWDNGSCPKLRNVETSQYLDGWPLGNAICCKLSQPLSDTISLLILTIYPDMWKYFWTDTHQNISGLGGEKSINIVLVYLIFFFFFASFFFHFLVDWLHFKLAIDIILLSWLHFLDEVLSLFFADASPRVFEEMTAFIETTPLNRLLSNAKELL